MVLFVLFLVHATFVSLALLLDGCAFEQMPMERTDWII